jgi:hypothetical protein
VELTDDAHPRYEVIWKQEDKPSELILAEEWIGKKGYAAKGKKVVERGEVKSVRFGEPLIVDEPEPEEEPVAEEPAAEEPVVSQELRGKEIRIPEKASDEPIELIFEEPTLF